MAVEVGETRELELAKSTLVIMVKRSFQTLIVSPLAL